MSQNLLRGSSQTASRSQTPLKSWRGASRGGLTPPRLRAQDPEQVQEGDNEGRWAVAAGGVWGGRPGSRGAEALSPPTPVTGRSNLFPTERRAGAGNWQAWDEDGQKPSPHLWEARRCGQLTCGRASLPERIPPASFSSRSSHDPKTRVPRADEAGSVRQGGLALRITHEALGAKITARPALKSAARGILARIGRPLRCIMYKMQVHCKPKGRPGRIVVRIPGLAC